MPSSGQKPKNEYFWANQRRGRGGVSTARRGVGVDGNQGVGAGMALGLARAGMAGRSACGMGPGSGALLRGAWGLWWLLARVCIQAFFGLRAGAASASCYQLNSTCQQRRALVQCAHGLGRPVSKGAAAARLHRSAAFLLPTRCARGSALRQAVWGPRKGCRFLCSGRPTPHGPATLTDGGLQFKNCSKGAKHGNDSGAFCAFHSR